MTTDEITTTASPTRNGSPQPAPAVGEGQPTLDAPALAPLCQLRIEIHDLQTVLQSVDRGQVKLASYADYIAKTRKDVARLFKEIEPNEAVLHLRNLWEQMSANPILANPAGTLEPDQQQHHLDMLNRQIQQCIYLIGTLTIPRRVNALLAEARPGYYIPFHMAFEDDVPDKGDRERILQQMALTPRAVKGGIIDLPSGLIYRYAEQRRERIWSQSLVLLTFLLCTAGVIAVCFIPIGQGAQTWDIGTMLTAWAAVLMGMITHVGIGKVKRSQTRGGLPPILAIGELPLMISAKGGQIMLRLLLALISLLALSFAMGESQDIAISAFLLGYSLDSFTEMFGTNVAQRAEIQFGDLAKRFGGMGGVA